MNEQVTFDLSERQYRQVARFASARGLPLNTALRALVLRGLSAETNGRKGGKARAANLSAAERSSSARKAALARWQANYDRQQQA